MGSAADQMAAAIEADGGAGLVDRTAGAAPGTDGGYPPASAPSPAGESNTDIGADGRTPDTIPYARFKEVNDRYSRVKDVEPLIDYGYDSDSLGQLAAFHQAYTSDPTGTWAGMADNLDLPQDLKDAIAAYAAQGSDSGAQGEPSAAPATVQDLPEDIKRRLEYVDALQAREREASRQMQLNRVVGHWNKLDERDEMKTSEAMQLNMIAALGASGRQFNTVEELAEAARGLLVEHNASVLGGAVRNRSTGTPLSVPGSAPAGGAPPINFGGNIRAATRAAEEAIKRGELPGMRE